MIQAWDTVRDNAYSHELLLSILIELSDQVAILTRNLSSMLFHLMFIFCQKPGPLPSNVIVLEFTYHPSYRHRVRSAFLTKSVCRDLIDCTSNVKFGLGSREKKKKKSVNQRLLFHSSGDFMELSDFSFNCLIHRQCLKCFP